MGFATPRQCLSERRRSRMRKRLHRTRVGEGRRYGFACSVFCSFRRRRGVYACWLKINSSMTRIIKKAFQNIRFSKKLTFAVVASKGFSKSVQYL
ncbi:hypothetical protein CWM53_24970 [Klebsiella sp. A-Nf5]|nr:hypothetical protein CWM53_24970 [Klebsiella sp. A-Nf5]PJX48599.1 hypothetical protein CWM60_10460 [Klebsiella sp. C1-16S-Nf17]